MLLPPPNVTGSLHLGHAMMGAIEDTIIRYKRLKGFTSLWVPGVDHAGISTQSVVEKKILKDEGKYRTDFTREEFVKKVWEWKEEYGNKIMEQFKRLGVSFDLSRQFFTLDEQRSKGVQEAFIQLFEKGILYREKRIVNWCCALQTAISDVELEEIEIPQPIKLSIPRHKGTYEFGVLIDFAYKLKKDPSKEIIVSTTRIETMLGDTAVAVHPEDERYKHLIGEELVHPFFPNREMKIISDAILVDKDFGTGAVKITPCHDPNDFESLKKRHYDKNCYMFSILVSEITNRIKESNQNFEKIHSKFFSKIKEQNENYEISIQRIPGCKCEEINNIKKLNLLGVNNSYVIINLTWIDEFPDLKDILNVYTSLPLADKNKHLFNVSEEKDQKNIIY